MRLAIAEQALQMVRHVSSSWRNVRDFSRDLAELVKLEAKLAVSSAVSLAVLGVGLVLLSLTGWALLILSLVVRLADDWLSLPLALLVVGLVNIAGAVPLVLMIKRHAGNLQFKATRRQLGMAHDTTKTQHSRAD